MTSRSIAARATRARSLASLTLAAAIALMAGATTANAADRQETDEEMSYALSQRVVQGAYGPHRYPSGAYASANPHLRGPAWRGSPEEFYGTSVPYDPDGPGYNDFQMQGR